MTVDVDEATFSLFNEIQSERSLMKGCFCDTCVFACVPVCVCLCVYVCVCVCE